MSPTHIRSRDPSLEQDARELRTALTELIRVYSFRDRDRICCYDVSVRQSDALDALAENGALSLNDLAAELYLDKSTTSRVVDALEKKGYAVRKEHPESKRSILVEATRKGVALKTAIERDLLGAEMSLLADVAPEVRQAAATLVARLAKAAAGRVDTSGGTCCSL